MPTSKSGPPPASFLLRRHSPGRDVEAEGALDGLDLAERAVADELDGAEVGGLVVAAVGDHELDVGGLAGGDHGFGFGDVGGHGLFAEHVLAGLGGADGVLGVHGVGQRDVDGVDGGVARDLVEVFVVVDGAGGDAVLGGDAVGLVAMAADQAGDGGVGGGEGAAHEMVGDAAQADDGVADFARGAWALRAGAKRAASERAPRRAKSLRVRFMGFPLVSRDLRGCNWEVADASTIEG